MFRVIVLSLSFEKKLDKKRGGPYLWRQDSCWKPLYINSTPHQKNTTSALDDYVTYHNAPSYIVGAMDLQKI